MIPTVTRRICNIRQGRQLYCTQTQLVTVTNYMIFIFNFFQCDSPINSTVFF